MKQIIVASKNQVKIQAVLAAFQQMFPQEEWQAEGISVSSGVPDQPLSDAETMQGAFNRCGAVQAAQPKADFWVGIEGGVEDFGTDMEEFAWVVVRGPEGRTGKAKTGTFFLPSKVATLIRQGKELGEADDIVFARKNSKHENGAVGILTGDVFTRTTFCTNAVILALIPFKHPELY